MRAVDLRVWAHRLQADLAVIIRESKLLKEESRRLRTAPHISRSFDQIDSDGESKFFASQSLNSSIRFHQSRDRSVADGRAPQKLAGRASSSRARVFVVDDDEGIRKSLSRLLRAAGYEALVFESAEEFLRRVPAESSGCLISDLCMPGFDGLALQREISSRGSGLPIIFLTAETDSSKAVQAMKNGALHFLAKPVEAAVLLGAIREALDQERGGGWRGEEPAEKSEPVAH